MSCFVVDDEIVHNAVRVILVQQYGQAKFTRFANIWTEERFSGRDIGRALIALNHQAYQGRYAHRDDLGAPYNPETETFQFDDARPLAGDELIKCFKSLECLCYQCAEDATCESPLYVAMREVLAEVALMIVHETLAYKATPWG